MITINSSSMQMASCDLFKNTLIGFYYGVSLLTLIHQIIVFKVLHNKKIIFNILLQISMFLSFVIKDIYTYFINIDSNFINFLLSWNIVTSQTLLLLIPFPFLKLRLRQFFYKKFILIIVCIVVLELLINIFFTKVETNLFLHSLITLIGMFTLYLFFNIYYHYNTKWYTIFIIGYICTTAFLLTLKLSPNIIALLINWPILRLISIPIILSYSIITTYQLKKIYLSKNKFKDLTYQYLYIIKDYQKRLVQNKKNEQKDSSTFVSDCNYKLKNAYQLTEREIEVIHLLFKGLSNKEISKKLFISINTVKYHISKIYEKLDVNSRLQLFNIEKELKNKE